MSTWAVEVVWDGAVVAGVTAVTPLAATVDVVEYRDLGPEVHRVPGRDHVATVRLERQLSTDLTFDLWARNDLLRKEVRLVVTDSEADVGVTYVLHGCWVCGYEVAPDLSSGSAHEAITLSVDRWERLTPPVLQIAAGLARLRGAAVQHVDVGALVGATADETRERLAKVLDEARRSGSVLLLDEADALFGRRTDVADAHDRFADAGTSALLEGLAAYTGPVLVDDGSPGDPPPAGGPVAPLPPP